MDYSLWEVFAIAVVAWIGWALAPFLFLIIVIVLIILLVLLFHGVKWLMIKSRK